MIRIECADWDRDESSIKAIRQQVFVQEQSVPEELEWDGLDDNARHWLAWQGDTPVATARLLSDGHIGRMAVLAPHRRLGIGQQLLQAIIDNANQQQLLEVYLYAQLPAIPFYQRQGFVVEGDEFIDAGIPHRTMRLRLSEQRLLGVHGGKFAIRQLPLAVDELIAQTNRQLRILSYDLDREVFDRPSLTEKLSLLARKSRLSDIKILICSNDFISGRSHSLLLLQQRLSSIIQLRKINDESEIINNNLVIADNLGVICQSIKEPELIWGNYNNRPIAEDFIAQFDRIWSRAKPDPYLKSISI